MPKIPQRPVDGEALFSRAEAAVAREPDKFACADREVAYITQRKVPLNYSSDSTQMMLGDPALYTAAAKALICMKTAAYETRARYIDILVDAGGRNDFIGAARAIRPIYAQAWAGRPAMSKLSNIRQVLFARTGSFAPAAAPFDRLLSGEDQYLPNANDGVISMAFSERGDPRIRQFYAKLVEYVAALDNNPATLRQAGLDLLPFINIAFGWNNTTFDITDQHGAGREDIARGEDPLKKARATPTPLSVTWLLAAKADPLSLKAMQALQAPRSAGGPSAGDIAALLADSFYRGHDNAAKLTQLGMLKQGGYGSYGAWVEWGVPMAVTGPKMSIPVYSETVTFLVNDLDPPTCAKVAAGFSCKFQFYIDHDVTSVQGELGNALAAALSNRQMLSPEERQQQMRDRFSRRDFDWSPATLVVSKATGRWRSASADVAMHVLAGRLDQARLRTAQAMNASASTPDPTKKTCDTLRAGVMANASSGIADSFFFQYMC